MTLHIIYQAMLPRQMYTNHNRIVDMSWTNRHALIRKVKEEIKCCANLSSLKAFSHHFFMMESIHFKAANKNSIFCTSRETQFVNTPLAASSFIRGTCFSQRKNYRYKRIALRSAESCKMFFFFFFPSAGKNTHYQLKAVLFFLWFVF